ncbi:cell division protein FtsL [Temperatibacter marinus]|uniref:Cell division protein FtsL n=1 Tax=Temperatibacter marinus TaxID=1456591 RepID=A0AA52EFH6_9PROT|nr:cell division protein FtsL [Temperatibacter marinus]WND01587.1 cell division protein FtsL [Temperatibacter marinus]
MRSLVATFVVILAILAGVAVVYIRFEVNAKTDELEKMVQQIEADRQAVHVLKTEIAYLTSPMKLQDMSLQYLAMMPPKPEQILTSISDVPFRTEGVSIRDEGVPVIQKRYRNKRQRSGL